MKQTLLKYFARFLALFPTKLPLTGSENKEWIESILWTFDLPNHRSYHHAICTMIMHLGPTTHRKSKYFFARSVKKSLANQVAYSIIQGIKNDEAAERMAATDDTLKKEESAIDGNKPQEPGVQKATA